MRTPAVLLVALAWAGCDDGQSTIGDASQADASADAAQLVDAAGLVDASPDATLADAMLADTMIPDAMIPDAMLPPPPLPMPIEPPACDAPIARGSLLPGPDDANHDAPLAAKALRMERVFHAITGWGHGANADLRLRDAAARDAVNAFVDGDAWALPVEPPSIVANFGKIAGLYGGIGMAADAYRYIDLRDRGAPCEAVDRARGFLRADLDVLHLGSAITGTPGVIARALARVDLPGAGAQQVVPLFDANGSPLPEEKDNGTWRADVSGAHPDWIWEDSCSRDMYVGWALAYAAIWEAIATDPAFTDAERLRMRTDAAALLDSLMVVRESGYDLEIRDADGRQTFHGILHENSIDRAYVPGAPNGFNAYMAVGITGALAYVTDAPRHRRFVDTTLIDERGLLTMARDSMLGVDLGVVSNYSAYNMAFTAGWLATRYLPRAADRVVARAAALTGLYERPDRMRQPIEQDQALYDLVAVASQTGVSVFEPGTRVDTPALAKIGTILTEFPSAPVRTVEVENCDAAEIESGACLGVDGTPLPLADQLGRGDTLVAAVPVPMRIRPISNFYWRSNPYQVNGQGDGLGLLPASDFRFVYWAGRLMTVR